MTAWKRTLRDQTGQQVAEAALVLPIVLLLLMGIYWFGLAFHTYATINYAAREGARTAITSTCATCSNNASSDDDIVAKITSALQASHLDPSHVGVYQNPPTPTFCPGLPSPGACTPKNNVTICRGVKLNSGSPHGTPAICGISVSFQYPFQFYLPFTSLNKQLLFLKTNVQMQNED